MNRNNYNKLFFMIFVLSIINIFAFTTLSAKETKDSNKETKEVKKDKKESIFIDEGKHSSTPAEMGEGVPSEERTLATEIPEWAKNEGVNDSNPDNLVITASYKGYIEDVPKAYSKSMMFLSKWSENELIKKINDAFKVKSGAFVNTQNGNAYCYMQIPGCSIYGYFRSYEGAYDDNIVLSKKEDKIQTGYDNSTTSGKGNELKTRLTHYFYEHTKDGKKLNITERFYEITVSKLEILSKTIPIIKSTAVKDGDSITTYVQVTCPKELLDKKSPQGIYVTPNYGDSGSLTWIEDIILPKLKSAVQKAGF